MRGLIWLRRFLTSSIGRKLLMAATGLLLLLFLFMHLAGNFLLYADTTGEAFDAYSEMLVTNPLLPLAEGGLIALFGLHIALGLWVSIENWRARKGRYAVRKTHGARTPGSATMWITGSLVLLFLLIHLYDFRLHPGESELGLADQVKQRLDGLSGFLIYVLGVGALGLHLSHASLSALQTLGINHPRYNGLIKGVGIVLAVAIGAAFLTFPFVYFFGGAS